MASLTWHSWFYKIKGTASSDDTPTTDTGIMVRGSDFKGEPNLKEEDWEANCGGASNLIGSDRVSADSEPEWEQKVVFGEFFEDAFYMLLGDAQISPVTGNDNIKHWVISKEGTKLPVATIRNAFYYDNNTDPYKTTIYDNAKMSELEIGFDDKGLTQTNKLSSNAPIINSRNPVEKTLSAYLSKAGLNDFKVYMAEVGTGMYDLVSNEVVDDKLTNDIECLISGKSSFNNNLDDFACLGTAFGKNVKDAGNFEAEGELELKWNSSGQGLNGSKTIIDKWFDTDAPDTVEGRHDLKLTDKTRNVELLIVCNNKVENNEVTESFAIYYPKVQITKAWSDNSGDDTKKVNVEYKVVSNGTTSPVIVDIITGYQSINKEDA